MSVNSMRSDRRNRYLERLVRICHVYLREMETKEGEDKGRQPKLVYLGASFYGADDGQMETQLTMLEAVVFVARNVLLVISRYGQFQYVTYI